MNNLSSLSARPFFKGLCTYYLASSLLTYSVLFTASVVFFHSSPADATTIAINAPFPSDDELEELIEKLGDSDSDVRKQASNALFFFATQGVEAFFKIQELLTKESIAHPNALVRAGAAEILRRFVTVTAQETPAFLEATAQGAIDLIFGQAFGGGNVFLGGFRGAFWQVVLGVTEINGGEGISDDVVVQGYIQHLIGPHLREETPNPNVLPLDVLMHPIGFPPFLLFQGTTGAVAHPGGVHIDVFELVLPMLDTHARCDPALDPNCLPAIDIDDWKFTIRARHAPEPSTFVLLGFGLILLAAVGRKRFSKKI